MARAQKRVSDIATVTAPVGGIDDTSPLAAMSPEFAIEMVNLYPQASALRVRDGYREHATGLASPGKTIMSFAKQNGTTEMFVCTDDGVFNITSSGATGAAVHTLTDGTVDWTIFSNIAGQWLIGCNGVDPAFIYDGTTWVDFTNVATPSSPGEITTGGIAPTDIIAVHQHKGRIWFIERDSMSAWYWPLNSVSGATTEFPMGGIFQRGGYLTSIFSWTMDAGVSVDDIFVLQTSEGEIAGYTGTDPASASTWALEARYYIGRPLGRRGVCPLNGDMLLLTEFGITPLSQVVGGRTQLGASEATASGRISRTLNSLVRTRQFAPGWEITPSPAFQYIVLSVPESEGLMPFQFVMNSVTGAWCTFDLPAITLFEIGRYIYFTDADGRVLRYGETTVDNVALDGSGGTAIMSGFQQAYNYFDRPTYNKHFKLLKPIFESTSFPSYLTALSTDFSPGGLTLLGVPGVTGVSSSQWDTAKWDEDFWSPSAAAFQEWIGILGSGYSASLILKMRTTVDTRFSAASWVFEKGTSL